MAEDELMSIRGILNRFRKDDTAGPSVEYVLIFGPLVAIIYFTIEMAIAYHWALSAQKAVEQGARAAVVSAPVVNEIAVQEIGGAAVMRRTPAAGFSAGTPCYQNACEPVQTVWCSGGGRLIENEDLGMTCNADRFQRVFNAVSSITYNLEPEDVSVFYEDLDLGYAGEPYVAMVTVSIRQRAFPFALGLFGTETRLPAVSSSLVAEDLRD